ncbi:MAG: IS110 family transposase [Gammaproteobacteria bacterium]
MRDYTGKTVFVGVDVHKRTYAVTCICEGEVAKRDSLKAEPGGLVAYLRKYFVNGKIKTVYEAGFSGFALHRYLLNEGIENVVVHAASVEISSRDRVKTDKRDSLKLALQLSTGRLKGIHVPTVEREGYREMSRLREKIAKDKRRTGTRIKSLLYRMGLIAAEEVKVVSKKWLEKVCEYACDPSIKRCIEMYKKEWLGLSDRLKEIDGMLSEQAQADKELEIVYRSVPGIGPVHARALANELGNMEQFSNEKKLFSFTGLTPSEYSSGNNVRQGHISRQGRSILRKTLVQAAWRAISLDESLRAIYERISFKSGKKRAIVGVARRLIGQIRSCFKDGQLYQLRKMEEICLETGEIAVL